MEIKQFTAFNLNLLGVTLVVGGIYTLLSQPQALPAWLQPVATAVQRQTIPFWLQTLAFRFIQLGPWFLLLLVLLPLAMTMALLWKTKEVILENVFGPHSAKRERGSRALGREPRFLSGVFGARTIS